MEYDPASPTDEPEDIPTTLDLSSIPLPSDENCTQPIIAAHEVSEISVENIIDIPLPSSKLDTSDIPLPPPPDISLIPTPKDVDVSPPATYEPIDTDPAGPLKFSLKIQSKPLSGQDASNESSGIFESSKDLKTDEPRSMPKLQAMMKRSKPSQLPVGVLPSKIKLPVSETKTELFLPAKENDVNGASVVDADASKAANCLLPGPTVPSVPIVEPLELTKEVSSLLPAASNIPVSLTGITTTDPTSLRLDNTSVLFPGISTITSAIATNSPTTHIPNLMSLTVQPVQTVTPIQPTPTVLSAESAAVLRQSKMSMANMQYVNPQKLRSAQMIATPLIANPALASQAHHNDDQSKSRDSRRRSRSRSRRRSRSPRRSPDRRGHRRRSSSSSSSSPPRHTSRRYQRRSRSRRSSEERYSRGHNFHRERERRWERPVEQDYKRSFRSDRNSDKRPSTRRSPSPKDVKRSRQRSESRDRSRRSRASVKSSEKSKDDRGEKRTTKDDQSNSRKLKDEQRKSTESRSEKRTSAAKVPAKDKEKRESTNKEHKPEIVRSHDNMNKSSGPRRERKARDSHSESDDASSSSSSPPREQSPVKGSPTKKDRSHNSSEATSSRENSASSSSSSRSETKAHERLPSNGESSKHSSGRKSNVPHSSLQPKNTGIGKA